MKKGLILGRFQPFHLGHLRLIEAVRDDNLELIICIGSAQEGRTKDNPFTTEERRIMVEAVVSCLDCEYQIYEIPDVNNNDLYVSHLKTFVPDFDTVYSGNSLVLKLFKASGKRRNCFPGNWKWRRTSSAGAGTSWPTRTTNSSGN